MHHFNRRTLVHLFLLLTVLGIASFILYRKYTEQSNAKMSSLKLIHLEFEVFGRVQGVFFRKYTQQKAKSINIRGWIRNTERRTVEGEIEGTSEVIETMKNWLRKEGSPSSRIDQAVFKNEREIQEYSFTGFSIKH